VIGRQPAHRAVDSQRNELTAGQVVLRDRRGRAAETSEVFKTSEVWHHAAQWLMPRRHRAERQSSTALV